MCNLFNQMQVSKMVIKESNKYLGDFWPTVIDIVRLDQTKCRKMNRARILE